MERPHMTTAHNCNARCPHHDGSTSPNCNGSCRCTTHDRGNLRLTWPLPPAAETESSR